MKLISNNWFKKTAFILQATLIGLGIAFLWILASAKGLNFSPDKDQLVSNSISFARAVERAQPAVVSIQTETASNQIRQTPRGYRRSLGQKGLGSGVIVDPSGLVLTNFHVIKGVDRIRIILPDGRSSTASVVGSDEDTDLALLRINNGGVKLNLPTLNFASSSLQKIGDIVLAIGNPYGIGQTVTQGIISATGRANINLAYVEDFIQTDANISVGNSGGALVNTRGELIGINTAVFSAQGENSGIGFAIPADLAKGVVQEILEHGRVIRGSLGVTISHTFLDSSGQIVTANLKGAFISEVQRDGPASKAGIKPADISTAINGTQINSDLEAKYTIAGLKPGEEVKLRIQRGNNLYDVVTTVIERPQGDGIG